MIVYHFVDAKYGLENIQKRRLKISRIMELNDPFEFLGVDLSDPDFRKAFKLLKEDLSRSKGIICFSKTWKNPLLWSHYADKHKGLCLGFDVPNNLIEKVIYKNSRLPIPDVIDESFMKIILSTKFKHWKYEQEYRSYVELEENNDSYYFSEFSNQLQLKRVIVGDQSSISRDILSDVLGNLNSEVESFKARAGFKKFEVVRQKKSAMWI